MADYSKQTVAQLRQLLKDRSIPSTGLTRKAQIIEKLEEADNEGEGAQDETPATNESDDAPADVVEQVEKEAEEPEGAKEKVPGPALSEAGGRHYLGRIMCGG
jgi:hypothetical protein